MRIGYFLSTEEYGPAELVEQAVAAERAGFEGLWISDHFHPWNNEQGNSPFVWSVIGAISQATRPARDDRRHLPDDADAPRDHRAGRSHECADAGREVHPRRRLRARPSTSTSWAPSGPRPTCGWRCWRRRSR